MVLTEYFVNREISKGEIKKKLEMCVISIKNKCDKFNCTCHSSYDVSMNENSIPPCQCYLPFEEALWCGMDTGEKPIEFRKINLPVTSEI